MDGLVIGHGQNPLVNQGDALVHVAGVQAPSAVDAGSADRDSV